MDGDRPTRVAYDGGVYPAAAGRDLLAVLLDGGAAIQYICMSGSCGMCRLRVVAGAEHLQPPTAAELRHYPGPDGAMRLGCQAVLRGDGDVEVTQQGV